jgi:hypothetical protein
VPQLHTYITLEMGNNSQYITFTIGNSYLISILGETQILAKGQGNCKRLPLPFAKICVSPKYLLGIGNFARLCYTAHEQDK